MESVVERMGGDEDAKFSVVTSKVPIVSRERMPMKKRPASYKGKVGDGLAYFNRQLRLPPWRVGMDMKMAENTARKPRNYTVYVEKKVKLPKGKLRRTLEPAPAFMYQKGPDGRDMLPNGSLIATHVAFDECPDVGPAGIYRLVQPTYTIIYKMTGASWRSLTSRGQSAQDLYDGGDDTDDSDSDDGEPTVLQRRLAAAQAGISSGTLLSASGAGSGGGAGGGAGAGVGAGAGASAFSATSSSAGTAAAAYKAVQKQLDLAMADSDDEEEEEEEEDEEEEDEEEDEEGAGGGLATVMKKSVAALAASTGGADDGENGDGDDAGALTAEAASSGALVGDEAASMDGASSRPMVSRGAKRERGVKRERDGAASKGKGKGKAKAKKNKKAKTKATKRTEL
jgi:hypothetical protein